MRRRDFSIILGGAVAWPATAWAQQAERVRVIGFLTPAPKPSLRDEVFLKGLRQLSSADPVGNRFIASLALPGGNITGISMMMPQLGGKRIEMLKEIIPGLS